MIRIWKPFSAMLAMALCCGCMATSATGKSTGPLRRATADRLTPPALGRFIEADVTPPQLSGKKPFAVIPYADGSVDVFAGGDIPVRLHSSDGLDWRQETPAWAAPAAEKFGPCVYLDAAPAENGAYYVLAQAESPHLILTQPDGSFREVPIAWTAQPLTVTPLDDGFGFTYAGSAAAVDAAGRTAARYGASGGVFTGKGYTAPGPGGIIRWNTGGARGEELSHGGVSAMAADENGAVYLVSPGGIDRLPAGGSVFETILGGNQYAFSQADCSAELLRRQPGADVFYVLAKRGGIYSLFRYAYAAEAPARPDSRLDVFSLEDSGVVRRAVIEYQRANPDVNVHYQIAAESQLPREETIRALASELRSGRGPDVLILDGMDASVYRDFLADPGEPEDLCFSNVMEAGMRDGTRFAIPMRILFPLSVRAEGEDSSVDGIPDGQWSLHSLVFSAWSRSVNQAPEGTPLNRNLSVTAAGTLQPTVFAAVRAGGREEQARRLIAVMLTRFVQLGDFEEGLPVRADCFSEVTERALENNPEIRLAADLKDLVLSQDAAGPPASGTLEALSGQRIR